MVWLHKLIAVTLLFVLFQGPPPPSRPPKPGNLKAKKPPPQPVSMEQV